jgi:hypothetical protein
MAFKVGRLIMLDNILMKQPLPKKKKNPKAAIVSF